MFFSPVLLSLFQKGIPVDLLCLSSGNFYGDGHKRCQELKKSAALLGIRHLKIAIDSELPDHPRKVWPTDRIQKYILQAVEKWHSKTLLSFDSYGVSGHSNHCQVFTAIAESISKPGVKIYLLKTCNVVVKYFAPLAFLLAICSSNALIFTVPFTSTFIPHKAMLQHRSQLLWFRYLYILFSAYMYTNLFIPLKHHVK
nr:N acetylglucosaminyl phosphatidylinositol [Hymenolepis microstoma]